MGIYSASSTGNISVPYVSSELTFTVPFAYEVISNMEIICSDGLGDDDSCPFIIIEGIVKLDDH